MRLRETLAVAAIAAVVAGALLLPTRRPGPVVSFDLYGYFYVNVLYALRAVAAGGQGLLWNPLQACGQPFFANGLTGLLYPPHWLFVAFGPDTGLEAVTILNLTIGALGAYALVRELGLSHAAAIAAAFAFSGGNTALLLNAWSPMHAGPYVWFPAALFCCERLLKAVTLGRIVALATVLMLALLPGFPQTVVYLYMLIGLRVVWALIAQERPQPLHRLAGVAAALALPPLIGAVQFLPALEFARESIRSTAPVPAQVEGITWQGLRKTLMIRQATRVPFLPVTLALAVAALATGRGRRSPAWFYAAAAVLCFSLAFPASPTYSLGQVSVGNLFGRPQRFLWPVDFCLSVLVAYGVELLGVGSVAGRWRRAAGVALAASVALALGLWIPGSFSRLEVAALAPLVLPGLAVAGAPIARLVAPGLVLAVVLNVTVAPFRPLLRWFPSQAPLLSHPEFAELRDRLSAQDRVALFTTGGDYGFLKKTAMVFEFASIFDYEPQMSWRYANYFTMLRTGRADATVDDVYYPSFNWLPQPSSRLLDLTAARYLVVEAARDRLSSVFSTPPLRQIALGGPAGDPPLHFYTNERALPRAFFVPRIAVIPEPRALLRRMAQGADDPREVAFVEAPPPSGWLGEAGAGGASEIAFTTNAPEQLVLTVRAPRRGFLFVADQYYPGWRAWVNDSPAPLLRANYAFRLVEVPAGESVVEFRFRPPSVVIGAAVSLATWLGLGAVALQRALAKRRVPAPNERVDAGAAVGSR